MFQVWPSDDERISILPILFLIICGGNVHLLRGFGDTDLEIIRLIEDKIIPPVAGR